MSSPPRWVLSPLITAGFALAFLLLLVAGRGGEEEVNLTTEDALASRRDRAVLDSIERTVTRLSDAETAQRGYLLTGDERDLSAYEEARRSLPADLEALGALVAQDPAPQRLVAALTPAIEAHVAELSETIEVRRREGAETALRAFSWRRESLAMDRIRSIVDDLQRGELAVIAHNCSMAEARRHTTRMLILASTFLGAVVAGSALLALNQQTRRRMVSEAERERLVRAEAAYEERLRAKDALRASEEDFRAIFEHSPLGKAKFDRLGRILLVNPRLCEMLGYSEAELLAMSVADLAVPADREGTLAMFERLWEPGVTLHSLEKRCARKDGTPIWVQVDSARIRDCKGRIVYGFAAFRDIGRRKRAEADREELLRITSEARAKAERAADRLHRFVDANIIGVISGREEHILEANDAFLSMIGYSRDDVQGGRLSWREITPPEKLYLDERCAAELLERGACAPFEKEYIRKDGTRVPILLGAALLQRSPFEWVSFVVDLTERHATLGELRAAQEQAESANRAKDEFLAVLSHELRSPLHAMSGWLSILKKSLATGRSVDRAVEIIERNVRLQSQIVNDLIDVSRIVTGKLTIAEEAVDLALIIQTAVETARLSAEPKGVDLVSSIATLPGPVLGDEQRLLQMTLNVVRNAVKFTPSGGRVTVTLVSAGGEAVLTVADTGIGIARDFLPDVFDQFRLADATTTRKHGGLGIGLAIAKTLAELHGGRIEAASEGPDRGATFTLRIPLRPAASALPDELAVLDEPSGLDGLMVLLLEDDPDGREALCLALQHTGAHVQGYGSAEEARRAMEIIVPDVIISDVGMPGESGYAFMRWVRARSGNYVPAIALTGFASAQDRDEAARAGFDAHLAKPVSADDLIAKLQDLLRRSGPRWPQSGMLPTTVRRSEPA